LPTPPTAHRQGFSLLPLAFNFSLHTLPKPKRLASKFQNVGSMNEPIQERSRQPFIAKDLGP
jgi:hypothetical protein